MERYVTDKGPVSVLPVPAQDIGKHPLLGFFLVGAYQEILGDIHNLFGDTHSCCVRLEENGAFSLESIQAGETIGQLLACVGYSESELVKAFEHKTRKAGAAGNELLSKYKDELRTGVYLRT